MTTPATEGIRATRADDERRRIGTMTDEQLGESFANALAYHSKEEVIQMYVSSMDDEEFGHYREVLMEETKND